MTQSLLVEEFVTTGLKWHKKKLSHSVNSQKNYRNHLNQFEKFLAERGKTIHTVEDVDIEQYVDGLKQFGYKSNTIAVKTASVSSYFTWMKEHGRVDHIPHIKRHPYCPGVHKQIPPNAIAAVFDAIRGNSIKETRDTAMIALIAFFGFKTEAVVALNMSDINLPQGTVKEVLVISLLPQLRKYIQKREKQGLSCDPDAPVFVNKDQKRISGRSLRRHLCQYFAEAKIDEIYSTRDLRYTYQCQNPEPV